MATVSIRALTDLWNDGGTTYDAIKMNVTNSASAAGSKLLNLQVGAAEKFTVDKNGNVVAAGSITGTAFVGAGFTSSAALLPSANDAAALGASGTAWSDLFLASGGVINWNAGDVTITHSANLLAFAGATGGYTFDGKLTVGHTANLAFGGNADNAEVIGSTDATGGLALAMFNTSAAVSAHLDFYRSKDATIGTATVVASGDRLGAINFFGAQQTGTFATQNPAAQIRAEVDGAVTSGAGGDMPGRIVFSTTADGAGAVTDRLILDAAGILKPNANDGVALGTAALSFSDLFLASGALINFANGDAVVTHSAGILTVSTGDLRVTTAGTNAASAVTVGGTQTLTNKTLTAPTINSPAFGGSLPTGLDASDTAKGIIEIAVQSEIETATNNTLAVTPGRQHFHPGHPKCWAWVTQSGGTPTLSTSYNITSITDTGTGQLTGTIGDDFSSANWLALPMVADSNSRMPVIGAKAAGSVRIDLYTDGGSSTDPSIGWGFAGFGDQ